MAIPTPTSGQAVGCVLADLTHAPPKPSRLLVYVHRGTFLAMVRPTAPWSDLPGPSLPVTAALQTCSACQKMRGYNGNGSLRPSLGLTVTHTPGQSIWYSACWWVFRAFAQGGGGPSCLSTIAQGVRGLVLLRGGLGGFCPSGVAPIACSTPIGVPSPGGRSGPRRPDQDR